MISDPADTESDFSLPDSITGQGTTHDATDHDYELSETESSQSVRKTNVYTTPTKRAFLNSLSQNIKDEIDRITCNDAQLSMKRCIVENIEEINAVQYAHLLARSTDEAIITSLEYSWGLQPRHLNVDSRFNVFRLNARLHHGFDRGHWILLPSSGILNKYRNHKKRGLKDNSFMDIVKDDGPFEYTLVSSSRMKTVPIHRQSDSPSRPKVPRAHHFEYHHYPFHTFPKIISHVHPRFVIVNAGEKIASGYTYDIRYSLKLKAVQIIYERWKKLAPSPESWGNPDDEDEDEEGSDEGNFEHQNDGSVRSYHTRSARWDAPSDHEEDHTGSPPSKRVKRHKNQIIASTETLVDIDGADQSLSDEEKKIRISRWIMNVVQEINGKESISEATVEGRNHQTGNSFAILINCLVAVWLYIIDITVILTAPSTYTWDRPSMQGLQTLNSERA